MNLWKKLVPFSTRKATEIHQAIVKVFGVSPQWSKRDYHNFAKEGYNANVWVYRCIRAVAQGAAGVPWILYQADSKGERKEVGKHELLNLINRPNEFMSRSDLIEAMIGYLLIAGNSYLDMVGPNDAAPPRELWPLRPDRVQIIPDATDYIKGFQYTVGGEKRILDRRRVSHLKYFHPIDDFYGLAPIEVAARGIDNDNAANTWNNSLLTNGGRPTGALVTEDTLSDPQYEHLKSELDRNIRGAKNAGKPMLLEGGLKWQDMSLSPRDMDFILSKKMSIIEICAAFSVPPEIVGYGEQKTYSNYQEARKALYEDAVIPALDKVRDKLNSDLVSKFGENLWLDYDKNGIEALQESQDSVYKRAGTAYKDGLLSKNEAREEIGKEAIEGGDEFYKAPQPIGMGGQAPNNQEEDEEKHFFVKAVNLATDEQKTLFWKSMERRRNGFYEEVEERVAKRFEEEKQAVLKAIEEQGQSQAQSAINEQIEDWQKLYVEIYVEVMQTFGNQLFNQLKNEAMDLEVKAPDIPPETAFNVFDDAVQQFIADAVALKVVNVTNTTKDQIAALIAQAEAEGYGIPEMAEMIDMLYLEQIIPHRSVVIARTEVIGASNAGNRYAAMQTGLPLEKEWIATPDSRTRDSHNAMAGEKRQMDEYYSNGLMFPGDPNGRAAEVIQCRCTEGYNVIEE